MTTPARIPEGDSRAREGEGAGRPWSILELLRWTTAYFAERGIETARLDAEVLLAFALGVDRLALYVDYDKPVEAAERAGFRELVRRRAGERVPVSQLVGRKEFWSLSLAVTPDVLTPRPDTETLVSAALDLVPDRSAGLRILDVGTGTGAVALALARELPAARLVVTDISEAALRVARQNADDLQMGDRVELARGSLFEPVAGREFDLIVSNPPYLAEGCGELPPELAHEPREALFAGPDGTGVLAPLTAGLGEMLAAGGAAAVEVGPEQAARVADWFWAAGLLDVTQIRDFAGRPRVVTGRRGAVPAAAGSRG